MKIANLIAPFASKLLTSQRTLDTSRTLLEARRKLQKRPHQITFYYRANDPYSFLLLQKVKQLKKDFNITLNCLLVQDLLPSTLPEPALLERYALKDARLMAQLWRLNFPATKSLPSKVALYTHNQIVAAQNNTDDFIQAALQAGHCYWHNDFEGLKQARQSFGGLDKAACQALLKSNQQSLTKKGHYSSGMLHYEGEWYWGLDRMHYLVTRLLELGLNKAPVDIKFYSSMTQLGQLNAPPSPAGKRKKSSRILTVTSLSALTSSTPSDHVPADSEPEPSPKSLDFYFSFRSPYSYLAIERTINLCKLYDLALNIKPVLPMVMRGLPVPRSKQLYIMRDAAREAAIYDIPFGTIVDPIGKGIEQCMAIYEYAQEQDKEQLFCSVAAKGIWAKGIDVSTTKGLRKVVERSELDWNTAQSYLSQRNWRQRAEANRKEMHAQGLWGVPSFRLGNLSLWGQDRIDFLDRILEVTYAYKTFPTRHYNH